MACGALFKQGAGQSQVKADTLNSGTGGEDESDEFASVDYSVH